MNGLVCVWLLLAKFWGYLRGLVTADPLSNGHLNFGSWKWRWLSYKVCYHLRSQIELSCFHFYVSSSVTTSVKALNIFQSHHPTVCFFFFLLHQPGIASQLDAVWVPFYTPELYVCLTWSDVMHPNPHPASCFSTLLSPIRLSVCLSY